MTFLFAVIALAAITFLMWRAFGPQGDRTATPKRSTPPPGPVGPDDDPDFLLDLRRKTRGIDSGDE